MTSFAVAVERCWAWVAWLSFGWVLSELERWFARMQCLLSKYTFYSLNANEFILRSVSVLIHFSFLVKREKSNYKIIKHYEYDNDRKIQFDEKQMIIFIK